MSYREVTMVEIKEILRLWLRGMRKKRIAALLGIDPKTVRRYVAAAQGLGLQFGQEETVLTEDVVASVLAARRAETGRARGESWDLCAEQKPAIEKWLREKVRLSKIRKLLLRQGVDVPYATLRRFAIEELGFGRTAPTIAVADCGPGEEVQLDTGWIVPRTGSLRQAPSLPGLDLHLRPLPSSLCLARLPRNHGDGDRSL